MLIDIFGLLFNESEEIHVGRLFVASEKEADDLVIKLDHMTYQVDKENEFIAEYRWEVAEKPKEVITLAI